MIKQEITYGQTTKNDLYSGVKQLAEVVSSTLGPSGHNVILDLQPGKPVSTKDGVTIAKAVQLPDPKENVGAQLLKQASIKTGEEAGDGTTTATVLAEAICAAGFQLKTIENTVNLKKGIDSAVKDITEYIQKNISKPITDKEQLKQVAAISANGDEEVGTLVSKALDKVGTEGAVTIEESKTGESYLDIVEGIQFDRGYKSPYFVTDEATMTAVLENNVDILLVDGRIPAIKDMLPVLNYTAHNGRALLIIAEDVSSEILSTLILNKVRAGLKTVVVKSPDFGDRRKEALQDIAVLTGGTVVSADKGMKLENFDESWLGSAQKVTVSRDKTTIIGAKGDEQDINKRVADIKTLIDNAKSIYDKEQLQARLARFVGGVAVLYVGGHTEGEIKERKDRVDDALHATKAALEEGVCPGGGKALLLASNILRDKLQNLEQTLPKDYSDAFSEGYQAVLDACRSPFIIILLNVGIEKDKVREMIDCTYNKEEKSNWISYNPLESKWVDMYAAGIIDPTKVIRLALKNAASVAGTILTSEAMVLNLPEEEKKDQQPEMMM